MPHPTPHPATMPLPQPVLACVTASPALLPAVSPARVRRLELLWSEYRYSPGDAPPVPLTRAEMHLTQLESAMAPADPVSIAREVDRVVAVLGTPRHAADDPDAWTDALIAALETLPADLVPLACERACTQLRYPPVPAELTELVREERGRRLLAASKVRACIVLARFHGQH